MQNEILVSTSHDYLVDSLRKAHLARFNAIVSRDPAFAVSSLKFLSRLLRDYHGSPCTVLIDEYDAPLECAFNSYSYSDLEKEGDNKGRAFRGVSLTNEVANAKKVPNVAIVNRQQIL
jgi:hypothetical protein